MARHRTHSRLRGFSGSKSGVLLQRSPLHLKSGSSYIPKTTAYGAPSEFGFLGEDAHFFGPNGFGVFDGVGGWARHGVDPRVYAQTLMEGVKHEIEDGERNAKEALHTSWKANERLGACTAVVGSLQDDILDLAWIGDAQVLVVRNGELLHFTESMTHSFNFPYQLGFGSTDTPDDAMTTQVKLAVGDYILAATDGLWDNISLEEVIKWSGAPQGRLTAPLINEDRGGDARSRQMSVAVGLAHRAFEMSTNEFAMTPFAIEAKQSGIFMEPGGKPDDITVLMAEVVLKQGTQSEESWCHTHLSRVCERRGGGVGTWEEN